VAKRRFLEAPKEWSSSCPDCNHVMQVGDLVGKKLYDGSSNVKGRLVYYCPDCNIVRELK